VVRSTTDEQELFDDGRDYVHFSFVGGNFTKSAFGASVGGFTERAIADSLTAVFWSDGTPNSNEGSFKFQVLCGELLKEID